jgi:hypothetical protein
MGRALARRILRLEQAIAGREDDELVEHELSDESKALLREVLTGLHSPEQIEATINKRQLVPKSLLRPLSPKARAILDEAREGLRDAITAAPPCGADGPPARD